jgi:hypothetical protein
MSQEGIGWEGTFDLIPQVDFKESVIEKEGNYFEEQLMPEESSPSSYLLGQQVRLWEFFWIMASAIFLLLT